MADALDHFQNFEQQERTAADDAAPNRDASAEIRQNGDNNTRPTEGHHLEEQQNNEDEDEEEMHTAEEDDDSEEMVTAREWTDEEENEVCFYP
jgi:hypothetical protein